MVHRYVLYRYVQLPSTILTSIRLDGVEALEGEGQSQCSGKDGRVQTKSWGTGTGTGTGNEDQFEERPSPAVWR